jgi:hypothetical protein
VTFKKAGISLGIFLAVTTSGSALWAQAEGLLSTCSNATVKGNFGFITGGLDGSGTPIMSVGQNNLNGAGKSTGTFTQSKDGTISTFSFTGTYTVKANCTGSGTLSGGGKTITFGLVIDSAGTHVEVAGTDPGHVSGGEALAQGTPICTTAGVKGTYGFHGGGTLVGTGALAFAGQYALDGTGKLTGTETISTAGTITTQAISGTYSLASTCKGKISYTLGGKPSTWSTVVVNGGKTILAIETDSGSVATSRITQQ